MLNVRSGMKVVAISFLLVIGVTLTAYAEYDRDHVVSVMHSNLALMGEITDAASARDWITAAKSLFAISEGMLGIMNYDPPRGSTEEWKATIADFVNAAYMGIGACGSQDAEQLQAAIAKLRALNRAGHGAFR